MDYEYAKKESKRLPPERQAQFEKSLEECKDSGE